MNFGGKAEEAMWAFRTGYTRREVQSMATVALAARDDGDPRWDGLCALVGARCGLTVQDVEDKLELCALGIIPDVAG